MKRVWLAVVLGAVVGACSPESKAKDTLGKYDTAFRICKEETEKNGMKPGEHRCALITSMAVDMSLADSGLEESKWRAMLETWLADSGYKDFYVPVDKRKKE